MLEPQRRQFQCQSSNAINSHAPRPCEHWFKNRNISFPCNMHRVRSLNQFIRCATGGSKNRTQLDNYRAKRQTGLYMPGKLLSKRCYPAHLHKPSVTGASVNSTQSSPTSVRTRCKAGPSTPCGHKRGESMARGRGQQEQERSLTVRRSDGGQLVPVLMATASSSYCFNVIAPFPLPLSLR